MVLRSRVKGALPFAVMVVIECCEVGNVTLIKAAMNVGLSNLVLSVYCNALGTLILLPFFIFHRHRSKQPPLNFSLLCRFALLGLLGTCLLQICGYTGINYSSPTLGAALGNLIPAFTFLLAIIFRMEKFDFRRASSQAKSLGTVIAISGAFVMTLFKGPALLMPISPPKSPPHQLLLSQQRNWVVGGLFLGAASLFSSAWNIAQTATIKEYPDEATIVFFYCFFGTVQCAVLSLIVERNPSAWILEPGIKMVAVIYAAILTTAFRTTALTWCLRKKGPVYVAMFKPTQMVIAVILGVIFLGDTLYLGSVVGGTIIALGFYGVIWGQAKENMVIVDICALESSTQNTPLLQN